VLHALAIRMGFHEPGQGWSIHPLRTLKRRYLVAGYEKGREAYQAAERRGYDRGFKDGRAGCAEVALRVLRRLQAEEAGG
jgi:hypothetical protein